MPVTPTSAFARPLYKMAQLLAASSTFQGIVGEANETDAMDHIYYPLAEDTLDEDGLLTSPRPRGIINPGPEYRFGAVATGRYRTYGNVFLNLEFLPAVDADGNPTQSRKDQMITFANNVGLILEEMGQLSGSARVDANSYFTADDFRLIGGPAECKMEEEEELFYGVSFLVEFGRK